MKITIISLAAMLGLFTSCSQAGKKATVQETQTIKTNSSKTEMELRDKKSIELPDDFNALVPVDLLDMNSTNVYDKYGIEFSGNCYACDLANLYITKEKIIWGNVCDENDTFEVDNFTFSSQGNQFVIKTTEHTLILTQVDKAPVYELMEEGKKLDLKNKRISKYFTTKQALPLFKEHDCGDFDG